MTKGLRFRKGLDDLEALAKAATPGPWTVLRESHGYPDDGQLYVVPSTPNDSVDCVAVVGAEPGATADAAYIAALDPQTVLALIEQARLGEALLRAVETEWYNGNLDESARDRMFSIAPPETRKAALAAALEARRG